MITKLNLNRHRQARIWLGELPDLIDPAAKFVEHSLERSASGNTQGQRAAVEMIVPSAGRALYGLLGSEFVSDRSGQLLVKMAVSENVESEIDWSLASSIDKVCAGLPVEYADSVLDGVVNAGEILGSGVLLFNCAAHGAVGSSPHMFRQLALFVVRLIASVGESLSEEELAALVSAGENYRPIYNVPIRVS